MSSEPTTARMELPALQRRCFIIGAVGVVGCAIGGILNPQEFFRSYLCAWLGWLSIPLGSLMIVMVHQLTGGRWGRAIQTPLRAAIATLPLLAGLFLVIVAGMPDLYIWTDADHVAADPTLQKKVGYLNIPRFLISAGIYFATWIGLAWSVIWSQRQSAEHDDERASWSASRISAIGLVLMGLTVTFAAIDWIMTLEPHWFSSIFGMLIGTAMVLPAFAFTILISAWRRTDSKSAVIPAGVWNDLGNLLLAMVMISAYMAFSQYFLIWSGNLPEEISWYSRRGQGVWQWLAVAMVLFYIALPFVLLLGRDIKRDAKRLAGVATMILLMHFVYQYWLVKPAFLEHHGAGDSRFLAGMHWLDPIVFLAVGGIWMGLFLYRLQGMDASEPVTETEETTDAD